MSGGLPEVPPGFEPGGPRPKRSRSAGAAPSTRSSPIASTPTSSPTAFGPPGAVGADPVSYTHLTLPTICSV
eukprot:14349857-Alexandrium_andersonii.AAC.1